MRIPLWGGHALGLAIPLLGVLFVVTNYFYFDAVLRAGLLPSDGDSIGIPIIGGLVLSPILMALFALWAWPALRRGMDSADLFAWDRARPWTSWIGSIVYGGVAAALIFDALASIVGRPRSECWWLLFTLPLAVWNLMLRAALVDRPRADVTAVFD